MLFVIIYLYWNLLQWADRSFDALWYVYLIQRGRSVFITMWMVCLSTNINNFAIFWTQIVSVCDIMETNESNMYSIRQKFYVWFFSIIPNNNINIYVRKLHFQPYWNTIWLNVIPGIEGDRLIGSIATLPMCKQVSFLD